ncbi:microcin C transport system substrate-binding protein [Sagittula marina]|uniref:Microcin C transport system substrate-binding protein n=1 Tax=Sagittula marina TaxID=943940 RepID=A0A7W6DNM7_9RHOB|nr:extracellular solute-binding protein [Sagittula marina]MBB3986062.1 microcin C transport system substrate-binding protein [Sagittula marina]
MTRSKPFQIDRRQALGLLGASAVSSVLPRTGWADSHEAAQMIRAHGYSFYGDLKYPADYPHWGYVNPDAPRGGEITIGARGTFDGFNRWAWRGNPESNSSVVAESLFGEMPWGGGLPADTITDSYCLVAREVEYPEDQAWVVFHLRDDVKFRNGQQVTAKDVIFTHNLFLEQGIRSFARSVGERVIGAEVIDDLTCRFEFAPDISRRSLISQVGGAPIFSKDWYEETGERLDEPSVLSPMASGPYQVADYEFNRYVVYERNPDYWGWNHPANKGRFNFDRVRFEYFADDTAEFEAFKAGVTTFRTEGSTKRWSTGYDFPAVQRGDVILETIPDQTAPNNSGIIFNTTRAPLDNRNIRHALSLAFNFEWVRESLQFSLTTQRNSFVEGQEWEAKGVPTGAELELLKSLGEVVPPEVLTEEAVMPHTSDPRNPIDRRNKRKGLALLKQEGWTLNQTGQLVNADGEQMSLNFLVISAWDDVRKASIETYVRTLTDWGIAVDATTVDSAQGQQRFLDKDYDLIQTRILTFAAAGTGLQQLFGSETAVVSSYNPSALQSPMVDAIIEAALATTTREDEVVALTALDRALRWERVQVPDGFVAEYWTAQYDMFEHPEDLPPYALGVLDFWWMNEDKQQALQERGVLK